MKLRHKKGFTIIELVIVIAVIGILTAVLVPTFINLTNKANEAADQSLVKNLNTVLATAEADVQKGYQKPSNPTDMFDILDKEGYKGETLIKNQKSGKNILYKLSTNRFEFEDGNQSGSDYWEFKKDNAATGEKGYSIYLYDEYDLTSPVAISSGLDVGTNTEVTNISYTNTGSAKTSVIRTNGGTLTINAPADSVNHYGEGIVLDVQAIKGSSYHEFGHFPKAKIAQGRIVVEEKGEIPSFEVTAVPTESNPIKIETSKDVTVSASKEVVTQLGSNTLENVNLKVTNKEAQVVVDEKMDKANVQAEGKTESDLVSITKVTTFEELNAAVVASKPYIMLVNDIDCTAYLNVKHSSTIDGDGHALNGGGNRNANYLTTIAFNQGGNVNNQKIDVALKNLTINNDSAAARPIETRGLINSLVIDNCVINGAFSSANGEYPQNITIGGSQSDAANVVIKNSDMSCDHYGIITFNPTNMLIENTTFNCWSAVYAKSPVGSAGSRGSVITVKGSTLNCTSDHDGTTNSFGAIVFEDRDVEVTINDSFIDVTATGTASQAAVLFNSAWAAYYETSLTSSKAYFNNTSIKGTINNEETGYDHSNAAIIYSGSTTTDPHAYLADGSEVVAQGLYYIVVAK